MFFAGAVAAFTALLMGPKGLVGSRLEVGVAVKSRRNVWMAGSTGEIADELLLRDGLLVCRAKERGAETQCSI
jgi:hypothetical protein